MLEWSTLRPKRNFVITIGLISAIMAQLLPMGAQAVGFQMATLRMDRAAAAVASGGTVCAKPASTATEASVKVTFPTGFTVGSAGSFTVTTTNLPDIGGVTPTAWPSIATATNVTGQVVTFPSGDLTVGTLYCFNFAAGVTNGSTGNDQQAKIETFSSAPAVIDSTPVALSVISNDQVTVTAVVPPSFQFSLSSNSDPFVANLSYTNVVQTTGVTATIATNAKGGWIAWVKDSQQGLYSPTAAYTINSVPATGAATTFVNGTEKYGMVATDTDAAVGCTVGLTAPYDGTAGSSGGGFASTFTQVGACPGGTSAGDTLTITEAATIASATPAASDYSDVITFIGAGLF